MSNLHGIGDYGEEGARGNAFPAMGGGQGQQQQGQQRPQVRSRMMMFGASGDGDGAPYPPINKVLAPNFSRHTFIFYVTVVQIAMFLVELIVGQAVWDGAFVAGNSMAGPGTCTMISLGAKFGPLIDAGQVFRFITPAFLHGGILHLFTNMVSQNMIGYTCEMRWGFWRTVSYYFATAFGASLMSTAGSYCSVSVGASGALLGIIGCQMAWLLTNWHNRDLVVAPCQRMCTLVWWLFIIFMMGIGMSSVASDAPSIDNLAHFGGWLSGILIGFAFGQWSLPISWFQGKERICKHVALACLVLVFALTAFFSFFDVDSCGAVGYLEDVNGQQSAVLCWSP